MRIDSMTATFGKLEHETLTLQPGLNVIFGENEWGKSTWCAFLLAMLYGLETREKSTKTVLAAKERYAPWSGAPMSGRMELNWQGRNITLERSTRGRIPMGEFRAYETETGLAVPELTAENCGFVLLGVERDVFCRSGFIRQADLPVSGSEALRSRLTALVTTGDDTGDAGRLAEGLKNIKNKCKYNKSGLLPQALAEKTRLEETLQELTALEARREELTARQREAGAFRKRLENHLRALENIRAEQDARQVAQARRSVDRSAREKERLEEFCRELPSRDEATKRLRELSDYVAAWDAVVKARSSLEPEPKPVDALPAFRGLSPQEAQQKAENDAAAYRDSVGRLALLLCIPGLAAVAGGAVLAVAGHLAIPGLALGGLGALLLGGALLFSGKGRGKLEELGKGYGTADWKQWPELADRYAMEQLAYQRVFDSWNQKKSALDNRMQALAEQRERLCEGKPLGEMETLCRQVLDAWDQLDGANAQLQQAQAHLDALLTMARSTETAAKDDLNLSPRQTRDCLQKTDADLLAIRQELGVCRGRMEALGDRADTQRRAKEAGERVQKLQTIYDALNLAQETLTEAVMDLQRRFAPRISRLAGSFMQTMTDGKYNRLTLTENLDLLAAGQGEDTVRQTQWRSDGTADQLYLSLRLAVAKILLPDAPVILDDALVRFDDTRHHRAMELLEAQGKDKQILLFTCQSREETALSEIRRQ